MKPAVFLDRDGTLIEDVGYIHKIEDLKLLKGTPEAVKKLNDNNFLAIIITNQSGVARGYFEEENVHKLNNELSRMLKEKNGSYFDGAYYCPHHPKGSIEKYSIECNCRKPLSGLIKQAENDFKTIDIAKSYVIGDKASDVEVAKNAGCKGILLKTGYGEQVIKGSYQEFVQPDFIADDIEQAVDWIIKDYNP